MGFQNVSSNVDFRECESSNINSEPPLPIEMESTQLPHHGDILDDNQNLEFRNYEDQTSEDTPAQNAGNEDTATSNELPSNPVESNHGLQAWLDDFLDD
jgi:hypothetical protein